MRTCTWPCACRAFPFLSSLIWDEALGVSLDGGRDEGLRTRRPPTRYRKTGILDLPFFARLAVRLEGDLRDSAFRSRAKEDTSARGREAHELEQGCIGGLMEVVVTGGIGWRERLESPDVVSARGAVIAAVRSNAIKSMIKSSLDSKTRTGEEK